MLQKITVNMFGYSTFFDTSYLRDTRFTIDDLMKRRKRPSNKSNKINVPEARAAMDKFKMEAASEVGVDLKEGYNGHLTSREAGSVGGQMVKKMIESYEKSL